jgi:hypothetical protein
MWFPAADVACGLACKAQVAAEPMRCNGMGAGKGEKIFMYIMLIKT